MAGEEETKLEEVSTLEITRTSDPELKLPLGEVREYKIYDDYGNGYWFSDIHKNKKSVVIFIRHFLCFISKELIDDLALVPKKFLDEANVRLVVIGCGPWKHIQSFREATGFKGIIFSDPTRDLYKKMGMHEVMKMGPTKDSKHIKSGFISGTFKSLLRGIRVHEFQGDVHQQGGAIILGPGDQVHHIHHDERPTDHASINDLLCIAGVPQVNFPLDRRVLTL